MDTRIIYLLRHGEPAFPGGEKRCIGRSEYPLSPLGRMQAWLLGAYFQNIPLAGVYCSGMERTRDTARCIREDAAEAPGLMEIDVGEWEGLTFAEIRQRWPELYELRGRDPAAHPLPGGESFAAAAARACEAFRALVRQTAGSIAVVAHGGVNQLLLCTLADRPLREALTIPQAYGCVNMIGQTGRNFQVLQVNQLPEPRRDRESCLDLLRAAGTAAAVIEHCRAAAGLIEAILASVDNADPEPAVRAALLHEVAAHQPEPARQAVRWLRALGYGREAELLELAQDPWAAVAAGPEAQALYLAERLLPGSVALEPDRRFALPTESGAAGDRDAALARIMRELGLPPDEQTWGCVSTC